MSAPIATRPHMPGYGVRSRPTRAPGCCRGRGRSSRLDRVARLLARDDLARRSPARDAGLGGVVAGRAVVQLRPAVAQGAQPRARPALRAHHRRRPQSGGRRGRGTRGARRPDRRVQRRDEREVRHGLSRSTSTTRRSTACSGSSRSWAFGVAEDDFSGSPTRWDFAPSVSRCRPASRSRCRAARR